MLKRDTTFRSVALLPLAVFANFFDLLASFDSISMEAAKLNALKKLKIAKAKAAATAGSKTAKPVATAAKKITEKKPEVKKEEPKEDAQKSKEKDDENYKEYEGTLWSGKLNRTHRNWSQLSVNQVMEAGHTWDPVKFLFYEYTPSLLSHEYIIFHR